MNKLAVFGIIVLVLLAFWALFFQPKQIEIKQPLSADSVFGVWRAAGFSFNPLFGEFELDSFSTEQAESARVKFRELQSEISIYHSDRQALVDLAEINFVAAEQLILSKQVKEQQETLAFVAGNPSDLCPNLFMLEEYKTSSENLYHLSQKRNQLISAFIANHSAMAKETEIERAKLDIDFFAVALESVSGIVEQARFACKQEAGE